MLLYVYRDHTVSRDGEPRTATRQLLSSEDLVIEQKSVTILHFQQTETQFLCPFESSTPAVRRTDNNNNNNNKMEEEGRKKKRG